MKKPEPHDSILFVKVRQSLRESLDSLAAEKGAPLSVVVREALAAYLSANGREP